MRRFAQLYRELDQTTRTNEKLAALVSYFREAPPADAAWALHILSGRKLIRAVSSTRLRTWISEVSGFADWMIEECCGAVGDLAETLSLLAPNESTGAPRALHDVIKSLVLPLEYADEAEQRALVTRAWRECNQPERFLYHKLISGAFRVGVARKLVIRAIATVAQRSAAVVEHRLTGVWKPTAAAFLQLTGGDDVADPAQPYPFYLAYPLDQPLEDLGPTEDWQAEWKWDGVRVQLIRRAGETIAWSRGEELIHDAFPELRAVAQRLPDGAVLDGEVLAWENRRPLPFHMLQRRLNRKRVEPMLWQDVPIVLMAYDLLESGGDDLREKPLSVRRQALEQLVQSLGELPELHLSPLITFETWAQLTGHHAKARDRGAEGLMLKRRDSAYGVGRSRGDWWKWKVDPYTIDAVLIAAEQGHGRRAGLFTDYTFAVWSAAGELVPIAKAYSGLTDDEIAQVDRIVRNTAEARHGPVTVIKPEQVFELAFEGMQESRRHKSGLALRFPRMNRWRHDKAPADADSVDTVRALMEAAEATGGDRS